MGSNRRAVPKTVLPEMTMREAVDTSESMAAYSDLLEEYGCYGQSQIWKNMTAMRVHIEALTYVTPYGSRAYGTYWNDSSDMDFMVPDRKIIRHALNELGLTRDYGNYSHTVPYGTAVTSRPSSQPVPSIRIQFNVTRTAPLEDSGYRLRAAPYGKYMMVLRQIRYRKVEFSSRKEAIAFFESKGLSNV